ncbi:TonB-dependent receptor [Pigmentiphaga soli]|uniref:TonB-dependent receptor n=1 Tax=Pigmentiphaga soli TaxID=1007095 RepID=A0ABP8GSK9_9BURK
MYFSPSSRLTPLAAAVALAFHAAASAQTAPVGTTPAATQPAAAQGPTLRGIVVTANPLGSDLIDLVPAVSTLDGDDLAVRRGSSLGDTLDGMPGVSSSYFGPNANRPVIRGMDGDRIRILQDGGASLDASALSYDHAVPIDPLAVDRVEVVRGPAALLYGGSALGGVVNVIDNRVPKYPVEGVHGAVDLTGGGADAERGGSAKVEAGNGSIAIHADAFHRETSDLHIPGYARSARLRGEEPLEPGESEPYGRLPNSSARQNGGAVGGSYTWDDGYVGASYNGYRANYGTVAEEDVRIDMKQDRFALEGEARNLGGGDGFFRTLRGKLNYTDYEHREIEDGEVGTTFKNRGWDARIEAQHAPIGRMSGVLGAEFTHSTFSALGEEAFVPSTDTDTAALFLFEELPLDQTDRLKLNFGGRAEHASVDASAGGNPRFSDAKRDFTAGSLSTGLLYKLNSDLTATGSLAYTERAPTFYELFANGPHVATGTYELGDPNAEKEKAVSLDLGLRMQRGDYRGNVSVYYSRFSNYLALASTGNIRDEDGELVAPGTPDSLPEYRYLGVPAKIYGLEAEGSAPLARGLLSGADKLDLQLRGDLVRGVNRDTGEALPRLAPWRLGSSLVYGSGPWGARVDVSYVAAQKHVPSGDTETGSYTLVGAAVTYHFRWKGMDSLVYLRGDNLTNREARTATSILRDIAPLGGRAVRVGLRTTF